MNHSKKNKIYDVNIVFLYKTTLYFAFIRSGCFFISVNILHLQDNIKNIY
jgi:hypothetical protein